MANSLKEFLEESYPDKYHTIKKIVKEMSTSGAAGGYLTKYAFGKAPISQYTKIGYKPVNQKPLRKKAKGMDYVDLHKR